jgi:hypothetical protein
MHSWILDSESVAFTFQCLNPLHTDEAIQPKLRSGFALHNE